MPALTHGRTKNGFNSFKSNKSNPKSKNSRLVSGKESRTKANNVVTGRSMAAKRAIQRRTRGSGISVIEGLECCQWDEDSSSAEEDNNFSGTFSASSPLYFGFESSVSTKITIEVRKEGKTKIEWSKEFNIDKLAKSGDNPYILETENLDTGDYDVKIKEPTGSNIEIKIPTTAQVDAAKTAAPTKLPLRDGVGANVDPKLGLKKIENMGELKVGTKAFTDCTALTKVPPKMKAPADSTSLFEGCSDLKSAPNIDTTGVTKMEKMFKDAIAFDDDVSKFDTTQVTNMEGMFSGATGFNGDVSDFITTKVTNMEGMFSGATGFNGDMSTWNTAAVTNMKEMFSGATGFNGDVSTWDTGNCQNMKEMFKDCNVFDGDVKDWNTQNLAPGGLDGTFNGCLAWPPEFGDNWHVPQKTGGGGFPKWLEGVKAPTGDAKTAFNKKLADMVVKKDDDFDDTGKFTKTATELAARIETMLGINAPGGTFGTGDDAYSPNHPNNLNFRAAGGGPKEDFSPGTPAFGKDFFNLQVSGLQQKKIDGELGVVPTGTFINPFKNFEYTKTIMVNGQKQNIVVPGYNFLSDMKDGMGSVDLPKGFSLDVLGQNQQQVPKGGTEQQKNDYENAYLGLANGYTRPRISSDANVTIVVKVVNNRFDLGDFLGTFYIGKTYTFNQEDTTNSNHPLGLSANNTPNIPSALGSHLSWTGTPGNTGATTTFIPDNMLLNSPVYLFCETHGISYGINYNPLPVI